tara:strand:- start:79 stop:405 length:327 start_codon:yes stop_codon:yes gene_type:complete
MPTKCKHKIKGPGENNNLPYLVLHNWFLKKKEINKFRKLIKLSIPTLNSFLFFLVHETISNDGSKEDVVVIIVLIFNLLATFNIGGIGPSSLSPGSKIAIGLKLLNNL